MPAPVMTLAANAANAALEWLSPVLGDFAVTTDYGAPAAMGGGTHWGIDLATPLGTPVYAPRTAKVIRADDRDPGGGRIVELDFGDGVTMLFAHLDSFAVRVGDQVKAGEIVAFSGKSGSLVKGAHLHIEAERNGEKINPLDLFDALVSGDAERYATEAPRVPVQSDGNCPLGYHRRNDGFFGLGGDDTVQYCERDNFAGDLLSTPLDMGKNVALAMVGVIQFFAALFDVANWAAWAALVGGSFLTMTGLYMVWSAT